MHVFIKGISTLGTLCQPGHSAAIIQDKGGFIGIHTAAHELAHLLVLKNLFI